MSKFVLIDNEKLSDGGRTPLGATELDLEHDGDRVLLKPADIERALGWSLKEQGLCRGDVCLAISRGESSAGTSSLDLETLAELLGRPLAIDQQEGVALLGTGIEERALSLAGAQAPDFELPDLSGRMHRLSDHRGKKVLLIAHASW